MRQGVIEAYGKSLDSNVKKEIANVEVYWSDDNSWKWRSCASKLGVGVIIDVIGGIDVG